VTVSLNTVQDRIIINTVEHGRPQEGAIHNTEVCHWHFTMANNFITYLRGDQNAPGERKLVQKLDFFILTFCCLMYFLKYDTPF
jgi:hypothetical protein